MKLVAAFFVFLLGYMPQGFAADPSPSLLGPLACTVGKFAITDAALQRRVPSEWNRFTLTPFRPGVPPAEVMMQGGPNPGPFDLDGPHHYRARGRSGYLILAEDGAFSGALSPSPDMGPQVIGFVGACVASADMPTDPSPTLMPAEFPFKRHKMAPLRRD